MEDGLYKVASWNGKDAVLIGEDGSFCWLSKNELPLTRSSLTVGEAIHIKNGEIATVTKDELEYMHHVLKTKEFQRLKELAAKEAARRALYGGYR